jgi:hypothetical protein
MKRKIFTIDLIENYKMPFVEKKEQMKLIIWIISRETIISKKLDFIERRMTNHKKMVEYILKEIG